jgi:tetratricopeptide (TPR) repeat protein
MYTIAISVLIGLLTGGVWTALDLWKSWQMGILLFVVVSLASFVLISRVLARRIEPRFTALQKQIQANQIALAIKELESLLPMGRWQILLAGQLHAQIGLLTYASGDTERAEKHLAQAGYRATEAQVAYAALLYRTNRWPAAREILDNAIRLNKKQILPYHVYAWLLLKEGDRSGAIEKLLAAQKVEPENESTKENLTRLQNGKDLSMKRFGMIWFGLQLERPPKTMGVAPGGAAPFRKGFRQKPQKRH